MKECTKCCVIETQDAIRFDDQGVCNVCNQIEVKKQQPGGHLNSDWVEWLMGYGQGYTDLKDNTKQTLENHQGFYEEPKIDRVTHNQEDKVNRLKSLGNSIVPQIAYNLGLAIIEDYDNG